MRRFKTGLYIGGNPNFKPKPPRPRCRPKRAETMAEFTNGRHTDEPRVEKMSKREKEVAKLTPKPSKYQRWKRSAEMQKTILESEQMTAADISSAISRWEGR